LRAAEEKRLRDLEHLKHLELDMDLRVGTRTRSFQAAAIGIVYGVLPVAVEQLVDRNVMPWTHWTNLFIALDYTLLMAAGFWWARQTLLSTELNRRYLRAMSSLTGMFWVVALSGWMLDIAPPAIANLDLLVAGFFCAVLAATLDRRLGGAALIYLLAFWGAATWPDHVLKWQGAGNFLACWAVAYVWRPTQGFIDARTVKLGVRY
jgi:hypothetical protein